MCQTGNNSAASRPAFIDLYIQEEASQHPKWQWCQMRRNNSPYFLLPWFCEDEMYLKAIEIYVNEPLFVLLTVMVLSDAAK